MEEQTPSLDYLKGFNEGYLLEKNVPDLSDRLSMIKSDSERIQGLHDGRKEYLLERLREMRPKRMMHVSKEESKEKSRDIENDKDTTMERD